MRFKPASFLDSDHYSSLPLPVPRPLPPQASFITSKNLWLQCSLGKILGRTQFTAPVNPPMNGIGRGSTLTTSHRLTGLQKSPVRSQAFS